MLTILDEDRYFAAGLQDVLQALNREYPVREANPPDLLFFTLNTRGQLPPSWFATPVRAPASTSRPRLVCIASRQIIPAEHCPGFADIPVLHRESAPTAQWFRRLRRPGEACTVRTPLTEQLSRREQEVLGYLAHLRSVEVGRQLRLSEKTISNYKRQAMVKLGLASTEGIRQWMGAFGELLPFARQVAASPARRQEPDEGMNGR
ncbi:response regulator transcription factor [Klebsiella aerogenes]|nr:response regulator transcription factor [Klebsiella aerogenes]ELY3087907.1 response regulator transcription factor [Klebsiella aerogenes]